ncbi:MAG: hypothetical protein QM655_02185 [Nocardioidaceae bacterium]
MTESSGEAELTTAGPESRAAREGGASSRTPRQNLRTKRVRHSRRDHVVGRWEAKCWKLDDEQPDKRRTNLTFSKPKRPRWIAAVATAIILAIIAGAAIAYTQLPTFHDQQWKDHREAAAAVKALRKPDLAALDKQLAAHRGSPDFAYLFASQTTPRMLGDALASVAGTTTPFRAGIDTTAYENTLTDLAGTLALATHGTGDESLPLAWSDNLIQATTAPTDLYSESADPPDAATKQRTDQDIANKQNLLLLISRGYWSNNFLMALTTTYTEYDQAHGDNGWSEARLDDAKYAPAPDGAYLTDGMLAMTAALTSNPTASDWAFTDFEPGTENISYDGSDHPVGKFTHYLFFEHHFPTASDGNNVGMTATLTALNSAIDSTGGVTEAVAEAAGGTPLGDSQVLQGLAKSMKEGSGCSWNPLDYGHCVVAVAKELWHWIEHWGHNVLDILSLSTFAPPPFDAIGIGAAATNATWYTVQGDYTEAGLSLAAAVPGLAFTKIAKAAKVATEAVRVAKVAEAARPSAAVVKAETEAARSVATVRATVGEATSTNYRATFFAANPELKGEVVVHHAIEQSVLTRYPGKFTASEIHSLENLRGIPNELNSSLHLSDIRKAWDEFYKTHPASSTTREDILNEATEIDRKFGHLFTPKIG